MITQINPDIITLDIPIQEYVQEYVSSSAYNPDLVPLELPMKKYVSSSVYKHVLNQFEMKLPINPNGPQGITYALRFIYGKTLQKNEIECHLINTFIRVIEGISMAKYASPMAQEFSL